MKHFYIFLLILLIGCTGSSPKKTIGELTWIEGGKYTDVYMIEADSVAINNIIKNIEDNHIGELANPSYIFKTKDDGKLLFVALRAITGKDTSDWVYYTLKKE